MRSHTHAIALVVALSLVGCDDADESNAPTDTQVGADAAPDAPSDVGAELPPDDTLPYQRLSTYGFFADLPAQLPAEGVVPYAPVAPLYSDGTGKARFLVLPEGETITFDAEGRWSFPEGTFAIKTFYFDLDATQQDSPRQILETRLLHRTGDTWKPYIYVWNEAQTEAELHIIGKTLPTTHVNAEGESISIDYLVPNANQCKSCHGQSGDLTLLGPRTRQLNSDLDVGDGPENQLARFERLGLFDTTLPALDTLPALQDYHGDAPLDQRARAYLEANCAHCHNENAIAAPSGLQLGVEITNPYDYGVCRRPVAAGSGSGGLFFDIVPGEPESSILVYRMGSTEPGIKMPEIPNKTVDEHGLQIITDWIQAMEPTGCETTEP